MHNRLKQGIRWVLSGLLVLEAGCLADWKHTLDTRMADVAPHDRFDWLVGRLRDPLESNPDDAAKELGCLGDRRAVEPLIKALRHPNRYVPARAAVALGQLGDPRAVEPLIEYARHDPTNRSSAAQALARIADPNCAELLLAVLDDKDRSARAWAARGLGRSRERRAVARLIELLEDDDGFVRWSAAVALGEIGDTSAVPALVRFLSTPDRSSLEDPRFYRDVAFVGPRALAKLGAVEALIDALRHENPQVREAAALELGRLRDPRGIPALARAAHDADVLTRAAAVEALAAFDEAEARAAVAAAHEDPASIVRRLATAGTMPSSRPAL